MMMDILNEAEWADLMATVFRLASVLGRPPTMLEVRIDDAQRELHDAMLREDPFSVAEALVPLAFLYDRAGNGWAFLDAMFDALYLDCHAFPPGPIIIRANGVVDGYRYKKPDMRKFAEPIARRLLSLGVAQEQARHRFIQRSAQWARLECTLPPDRAWRDIEAYLKNTMAIMDRRRRR